MQEQDGDLGGGPASTFRSLRARRPVSSPETDIDTFISIASKELDSDLMRSEKDSR